MRRAVVVAIVEAVAAAKVEAPAPRPAAAAVVPATRLGPGVAVVLPDGRKGTLVWFGSVDSTVELGPNSRTSALSKSLRIDPDVAAPKREPK